MRKKLFYFIIILTILAIGVFFCIPKKNIPTENTPPTNETLATTTKTLSKYIEVLDSCNFAFVGDCVNMRSGPGVKYPVVTRLRNGVVLLVADTVVESDRTWYKIGFAHELLYPERVQEDWYVAADIVREFTNSGDHNLTKNTSTTTKKHIVVSVSEEKLYAYDGDTLFMEEPISTGLEFTPTPRGTFTIFEKTPSRFMQGPIPNVSEQKYDLPGVPWDLYFTQDGAVIHGAYWHNNFGKPWSHGCVNLSPENAKKLYMWADIGMSVTVKN